MADTSKPTVSVKLVLLGEAAVGKSSLVSRFVNDEFHENKEPTIGAAFLTQKCSLSDRTVKFEIWDTAGQERFASLAPMYYRNAQSALVVYDVTKPASFVRARHWVNEIKSQGSPNTAIALVGNKVDLLESANNNKATGDNATPADGAGSEDGESVDHTTASDGPSRENPLRKVSIEEGEKFAEQEGLMFFEASAKTSQNVRKIFLALASKVPIEQKRPAPTGRIGEDTNVNLAAGSAAAGKSNCAC